MPAPNRAQMADVRGASRLLFDASTGVVDVVERMHRTIQRRPGPFGRSIDEATRGITGFVYRNVRGVMRLVGQGVDLSLAPLVDLFPEGETTAGRDVFVAILNGIYGDYLLRTGNPLAIEMSLRHAGTALEPSAPTAAPTHSPSGAVPDKVLVLVHGLCMSEHQWLRDGRGHGSALAEEFGYAPVYVRYNSGLHVAENGRRLADQLQALVDHWPRRVAEVSIVGHSMGGLVARSAAHHARGRGQGWPGVLRRLVFLGTPHHGAPLERGGHRLDYLLDLSPYSAPFTKFGRMRSAGIQALRHGAVTADSDDVVPLPAGVACYAAAATLSARRTPLAERLIGDGLVPLDSALGRHADRRRSLDLPGARQWVGHEMGHLELLQRPEVYARLRAWFAEPA
ncbi:MAG TPA: hypothetical protein VFI92_01080 [Steroidobacteraceae bacterium]|nr:hypothetical protein [Steroidobacteraceae bacterium]